MSKHVVSYSVRLAAEEISFNMPKRSRVVAVGLLDSKHLSLYAEESSDADTRAFDTGKHQRHFKLVMPLGEVPADGVYVGLAGNRLVYEVPGVRGSR